VANDNVERVSSGMFSNSFVDSVVTTLHSLVEEIAKITDIAKSVIASFGTIIKSLKNLNKDVTTRFRVLNNELNASRIDFIRTVLAIPKSEAPVRIDGVPVNIKQEEIKKDGGGEDGATSFMEKILELWLIKKLGDGALGLLKNLIEFAKGAMNKLIQFAAETLPRLLALLEGALTGPTAQVIANGLRAAIFNPLTLAGAGFVALAYWAGKQREMDPEGWLDFQLKLRGAGARSSVITGPQAETDKLGPVQESGRIQPAQFLKANGLTKEDVDTKNSTGDIVTVKDGRWFDTKAKTTDLQPAETNPIINKGRPTQSTPAAPAGAPAGAPAATSSSGSGAPAATSSSGSGTPAAPSTGMGTGGGNSAPVGSPAPATPASPTGSNMGAPAGEVKQESNAIAPPPTGAPAGTAKTTSMGPPPSGPSGGEGAGSGGGVAVVQNSSVQNVGTVAGAETGGMTGQNLPMYSRNPKLQAAFERQVMRDHQ
jgi:hypothetical protein